MRVPLLNFEGGSGVPLLNSGGGLGAPLLNFKGGGSRVPLLNFEEYPGSRVPGLEVLVPLLHHAILKNTNFEREKWNEMDNLDLYLDQADLDIRVSDVLMINV